MKKVWKARERWQRRPSLGKVDKRGAAHEISGSFRDQVDNDEPDVRGYNYAKIQGRRDWRAGK